MSFTQERPWQKWTSRDDRKRERRKQNMSQYLSPPQWGWIARVLHCQKAKRKFGKIATKVFMTKNQLRKQQLVWWPLTSDHIWLMQNFPTTDASPVAFLEKVKPHKNLISWNSGSSVLQIAGYGLYLVCITLNKYKIIHKIHKCKLMIENHHLFDPKW